MDTLTRIEECVTEKGWKNVELAKRLGLTRNAVTEWRSGRNQSYLKHIERIAELLDTTPAYLLGETDIKERPDASPTIREEISALLREVGAERPDGTIDEKRLRAVANYLKVNLPYINLPEDKK